MYSVCRAAVDKAQLKIFVCDINDVATSDTSPVEELSHIIKNTLKLELNGETSADASQVFDNGQGEEDYFENDDILNSSKILVVLNKLDILSSDVKANQILNSIRDQYSDSFLVSCVSGHGINELENGITTIVKQLLENNGDSNKDGVLITRERHRKHLKQCLYHLENFLEMSLSMDLAAEELRLSIII